PSGRQGKVGEMRSRSAWHGCGAWMSSPWGNVANGGFGRSAAFARGAPSWRLGRHSIGNSFARQINRSGALAEARKAAGEAPRVRVMRLTLCGGGLAFVT